MLRLVVLLLAIWTGCGLAIKFPIVLVPGICGSQLEARHTKKLNYPYYCPSMKDWTEVWLTLKEIAPIFANCFARDMSLKFDPKTKTYNQPDGVEVRVSFPFGSTKSIEYLDDSNSTLVKYVTKYFHEIVNYFVKEHGYVRDDTIVAAPYDWRKSPWSMDSYLLDLKSLIENVTAKHNAPAILISHSMGGPVTQSFLNLTMDDWKAKHVAAWFPVDGVWIGSPKVLKAMVSGDSFNTPAPDAEIVQMERTIESTLFLMPMPGLWPKNATTLVKDRSTGKSYGVHDYVSLLQAINISHAEERVNAIMEKRSSIVEAPGVRVYCIYGTGVKTAWGYEYKAFDGSSPKSIYGDGDGTVPLPSLKHCETWAPKQSLPVKIKEFPGVKHVMAIMDPDVFAYIGSEIAKLQEEFAP